MVKKSKTSRVLIVALTVEKTLQHLLVALAFRGFFPGLGTPDIGPNFAISHFTMVMLNLFYTLLFVIGLYGIIKHLKWRMPLIITLAALDISLEFLFHGLFYITVSVIVSTILIIVTVFQMQTKTGYKPSTAK
jgi:hypothetical protein